MKKEDKELLLIDLLARLPYGVKVRDELGRINRLVIGNADLIRLYYDDFTIYNENWLSLPYLRPMSSMTDAEKRDFPFPYYFEWIDSNFSLLCSNDEVCASIGFDEMYEIMDWLNAHHFDYRNLIEKGLAIEAPKDMYNNK